MEFTIKEKERLLLLINELGIKDETCPLDMPERAAKKEADECLTMLWRDKESK